MPLETNHSYLSVCSSFLCDAFKSLITYGYGGTKCSTVFLGASHNLLFFCFFINLTKQRCWTKLLVLRLDLQMEPVAHIVTTDYLTNPASGSALTSPKVNTVLLSISQGHVCALRDWNISKMWVTTLFCVKFVSTNKTLNAAVPPLFAVFVIWKLLYALIAVCFRSAAI